MDGTRESYTKCSRPERNRKIPSSITYLWNLKYGTDDPTYKTAIDHSQGEQTAGSQRGGGTGEGEAWMGSSEFSDANCYVWNGWAMGPYCMAQGTVCDWVTLLYNRN